MDPTRISSYVWTGHAIEELRRRGLSTDIVRGVVEFPEQAAEVRPGRIVLQSRVRFGPEDKIYVVRVFVDVDRDPAEIVTAYRTSKIEKYWRGQT